MASIFNIAVAAGTLLSTAHAVMAQDARMRANTFGNGVPPCVEFCAQPPQFGASHAQPYGPHSLPPSVIMRNPEVPACARQADEA